MNFQPPDPPDQEEMETIAEMRAQERTTPQRIEQRLTKTGSILMHDGKIQVHGFEGDDCGCSEVATRALIWAIGELQRELVEELAKPGGSGNVSIDFERKLREVLGIEDDWF